MKREFFIVRQEWRKLVGGGSRLLVFSYIATMCENKQQCNASISTIAEQAGCCEMQAARILAQLIKEGHIIKEAVAGKANVYKTPLQNVYPPTISTPLQNVPHTPIQNVGDTPIQIVPPKSKVKTNNYINNTNSINSRGETPREEWLRLKAQTEREQAQRDAQQAVSAQDREQVILMQKEWRQKHKLTN